MADGLKIHVKIIFPLKIIATRKEKLIHNFVYDTTQKFKEKECEMDTYLIFQEMMVVELVDTRGIELWR